MRNLFIGVTTAIGFCSIAQAKTLTFPVSVSMKSLYTAGTTTYLGLYVSPELDKQIEKVCGQGAVLLALDVHYTVKQVAGDVSDAELSGTASCETYRH